MQKSGGKPAFPTWETANQEWLNPHIPPNTELRKDLVTAESGSG